MKKFRATFDASFMTVIPNTFTDNQLWIEFESENIDQAEEEAFRGIVYQLVEVQQSVLRKIELLKIEELEEDQVIQKRYYSEDPEEDDDLKDD